MSRWLRHIVRSRPNFRSAIACPPAILDSIVIQLTPAKSGFRKLDCGDSALRLRLAYCSGDSRGAQKLATGGRRILA
jgi:hypothetical protein